MKKIILLIATLLFALSMVACAKELPKEEYSADLGEEQLVIDEGITIDGKLDDAIWGKSVLTNIEGAKNVDVETYGERNMDIYTYIGEKAVYFAFDVTDQNLYYNRERSQGQNSTVELYFAGVAQEDWSEGCWSLRVTPTGELDGNGYVAVFYRVQQYINNKDKLITNWASAQKIATYSVGVQVDGTVKNSLHDDDYNPKDNKGYTVEMAIDINLLGEYKDAILYTVGFCQSRDFENNRLANNFLNNGLYNNPATWTVVTNDGLVDDRYTFIDNKIEADEGFVADGNFDESIWANKQGRTFVSNVNVVGSTEKIEYTLYANTTDKGLYIGLESNDGHVYYHPNVREYFSTGAELNITANGATRVDEEYTLQYRFNVGGVGKRHRGRLVMTSAFAYGSSLYYPAKVGGKVIGGELNQGGAEGWTGEIFIPWSSFRGEIGDKDSIAIMMAGYHATADASSRKYIKPADADVCSNGGPDMNPQVRFFKFKNGKPLYEPLRIHSLALDGSNLVGDYYEATVDARYYDNVIAIAGFEEKFPDVIGGEFDFAGVEGVLVTDNEDGSYTIKIPATEAEKFETVKEIGFRTPDGLHEGKFDIVIDSEFTLDGRKDEAFWSGLKSLKTTQTMSLTVSTDFTVALKDNAFYLFANIVDPNYEAYKDAKPLGLEMYLTFADEISYENTYCLRLLSNNEKGLVYRYSKYIHDTNPSVIPWIMKYTEYEEIQRRFVNNGDGTYSIEAKIPYSVLGREGKPEYIAIAPFTKFVTSTSANPGVSTKIIQWEGAAATVNLDLYQRFNETGFAPDKNVLFDAFNDEASTIVMIKGQTNADKYEGSFTISLYPNKKLPISDANFGEMNQYITNNGNGNYAYSIPKATFANDELDLAFTSALSAYSGEVTLSLKPVEVLYAKVEGLNLYATHIEGGNYKFNMRVTADEAGKLPVETLTFASPFSAVEKGNGLYTVSIPVAIAQNVSTHNMVITYEGEEVVKRAFNIVYNPWTDVQINSVKSYFDFNGEIADAKDNQIVQKGTLTFADRMGSGDAINLKNNANQIYVQEAIGTGDFSVAFDFWINSVDATNTDARYELFNSGANVDKGKDTIQLSVRSNWGSLGLRFALGDNQESDRYKFDNLDDKIRLDAWNTLTFTVNRNVTNVTEGFEKVEVTLYLNGEFIKTLVCEKIELGQVLGNGTIRLGGGDSWGNSTKSLKMDNFLLYDGILSEYQIADIAMTTALLY